MRSRNLIDKEFRALVDECVRVSSAWRNPLPADSEQWDPYVRVLLHGLAYQQARIDEALGDILPRFWCELAARIDPSLLRPTLARAVVKFDQAETTVSLLKGTRIDGIGRDGKQVRFSLERDVAVHPLSIAEVRAHDGGVAVGLAAPQSAGRSLGEVCGSSRPRLTLFLSPLFSKLGFPGSARRGPDLVTLFYQDGQFLQIDSSGVCWYADTIPYDQGSFVFFAEEQFLVEIDMPGDLTPESLDGSKPLYWFKFSSVSTSSTEAFDLGKPNRNPLEINCATAANQYSISKTFSTDPTRVGYVRLEQSEWADRIVELERIWAGQYEYRPAHLATEGTYSTYVVDWLPLSSSQEVPLFNLVLNIRPQDRSTFAHGSVNVDMLVTDGHNAANLGPNVISNLWEKKRDRRFVTVQNVSATSAYYSRGEMYPKLADWVAMVFRSRGRSHTRSDITSLILGQYGRYIASAQVQSELQQADDGVLVNGLRLKLGFHKEAAIGPAGREYILRRIHNTVIRSLSSDLQLEIEEIP
jgi:hypothetical protein